MIGAALFQELLPLEDGIVLVSGRAGFEIVQKCLLASVPVSPPWERLQAWPWNWRLTQA